ncbi:MAG: sel1 repeat family protein [Alphaproteobacteria bacterium]|nr:MAG: sel1 repeat family protein [Alphaproteobacteria bacterium]
MDVTPEEAIARADQEASGEALYDLGILFSTGQGVEMDYVAAHKWFNLAALRGSEDAKSWRQQLSEEMSQFEIAEAQRQAREWLSKH